VENKQRHKRLRFLLKRLNSQRKLQARKIDILCNDLIGAHRDFIRRLNIIGFKARFYESILASADLAALLSNAVELIKEVTINANAVFFLRRDGGFELHLVESDKPIALDHCCLENCFSSELVESICKSNRVCTLEDMFAMGLEGNLSRLNEFCAVTIPLGQMSRSIGFILLYRSAENSFSLWELNKIKAVTSGLSKAIKACQALSISAD